MATQATKVYESSEIGRVVRRLVAVVNEEKIFQMLQEHGQADLAADALIKDFARDKNLWINLEVTESLGFFLLNAGFQSTLIHFVLKYIKEENFQIPWGSYLEVLGRLSPAWDRKLMEALKLGVDECGAKYQACSALSLTDQWPELSEWREERVATQQTKYLQKRSELFENLKIYRSQHLHDQEKDLLDRLLTLYPEDTEVIDKKNDFKKFYAEEVIQRYRPRESYKKVKEVLDPEVEKKLQDLSQAFLKQAQKVKNLSYDLAIGLYFIEDFNTALKVLSFVSSSSSSYLSALWMKLEIYLKLKMHLQGLQELITVEQVTKADPESAFSIAYLKAQYLWGLGQKASALSILESLASIRPQYRSVNLLLSLWRNQ